MHAIFRKDVDNHHFKKIEFYMSPNNRRKTEKQKKKKIIVLIRTVRAVYLINNYHLPRINY